MTRTETVADKRHAAAIAKGVTCPKATCCPICWPSVRISLQKGVREVVISDMLAALKHGAELRNSGLLMESDAWACEVLDMFDAAIAAAEAVGIRASLADGDA